MRIGGGEFAGRIIKGSPGSHVRPTTDRARESFFNILTNKVDFESIKVLDLFAGTGIMALEFISRGCESVYSVDLNTKSIKFMLQLKDEFGVDDKWNIEKQDALRFLENDISEFDLIFADPPYAWTYYNEFMLKTLEKMKPGAMLCLEHDKNKILQHQLLIDARNYGQSVISFFQK